MKRPGKTKKQASTKLSSHKASPDNAGVCCNDDEEPLREASFSQNKRTSNCRCQTNHVTDRNLNGVLTKENGFLTKDLCTCSSKQSKQCKQTTLSSELFLFPEWLPWVICAVTLVFRVHYVLQPINWWILHPDEVYQTTEVAHTEAFSYGFLPYEYLPPPGTDVTNITISDAYAKEIRLGMYSMRSFMLPKLLSFILIISKWWGISSSPYLIIKVFHTVVSSFLPFAVYLFTRTFYKSSQVGVLSSLLTSSSICLNVLGTHSLTNGFLSTFVFLALVQLVKILNKVSNTQNSNQKRQKNLKDKSDINANEISPLENVNSNSSSNNSVCYSNFSNAKSLYWMCYLELVSGLLLALCVYIRIDIIAIPVILVFLSVNSTPDTIKLLFASCRNYFLGFIIGSFIGGYFDVMTYGVWFISPRQWLNFNVLSKTSGVIFGISPSFYYCSKLLQVESLFIVCVGSILLSLFFEIHAKLYSKTYDSIQINCSKLSTNLRGVILLSVFMLLYSGNNHKELRFIHNTIVFLYICFAHAMYVILCKAFAKLSLNQNNKQYFIYSVYLFIALFSSSHIYDFCNLSKSGAPKWTYGGASDSNEVNICMDYIRQRHDVTGVFIDREIHMTGAYSVLQKDVPIFSLNKFEFMEFDDDAKLRHGQHTLGDSNKHVKVFGRISEFISVFNTPLLLKQLISKKVYNYLILRKDRGFEDTGYKQVFEFGNSRVLKRTFDYKDEIKMAETASRIPLGTNATVLEYEADWLRHFGLYVKAEERLLFSNRLDPTRIGPFRALLGIYRRLGVVSSYQSVLNACVQVHSMEDCLEPYQPLRFHSSYYREMSLEEEDHM